MNRDFSVRTSSGRVLEACEGGDLSGLPIFSLHGTPGSRLLYPPHLADAERRNIRLIGYNRPGYGGSTPVRGRLFVDVASDVTAIADALGLDRFAVWGISGGGSPALACAAALPGRVVAASSLAGTAPFNAEGLEWFAGMGEFNIEDTKLMLSNQGMWEVKSRQDADVLLKATRAGFFQMFDSLLSDVDRGVLSDELLGYYHEQYREAYSSGIRGSCDDTLSICADWGFDPAAIKVPVQVWQGRHDRFVPFSHGRWLASKIPGAEARFEEQEGHLSLFARRVPEVHAWLSEQF
jgi:pimeloyl-ACP methyl ester carboxylesterase